MSVEHPSFLSIIRILGIGLLNSPCFRPFVYLFLAGFQEAAERAHRHLLWSNLFTVLILPDAVPDRKGINTEQSAVAV